MTDDVTVVKSKNEVKSKERMEVFNDKTSRVLMVAVKQAFQKA